MSEGPLVRLRACALLVDEERVLLCQEQGDAFWTLPGGSVEAGEFAREALARELVEELGDHGFRIGLPFLVCENLFSWRGQAYQEVVLGFRAGCADRTFVSRPHPFVGAEPHLTFVWTKLTDLPRTDLRPAILTDAIGREAEGSLVHECLRENA